MERKSDIRKRIIKERKSLPLAMKVEMDRIIAGKVTEHPLFLEAKDIFCYLPIRGEVDTRLILETAWKAGKRVAVPKVLSDTKMEFFYIHSMSDLETGTFGVLEPTTDLLALPENACVIVPGSVFDKACNRIGYGGGYYDRYLALHTKYQTIGLAYDLQITEKLPLEETDIPLRHILTEKHNYQRI